MARVPTDFPARTIGPGGVLKVKTGFGARVFVYDRGTTDEVTLYDAATGGNTVSQPIQPNSEGRFPYWIESGAYDLYAPSDDETEPWEGASSGDIIQYIDDQVGQAAQAAIDAHKDDPTDVHQIVDTADLLVTQDLTDHAADGTAIHGIADTADLLVTQDLTDHTADTTDVHGILDTAALILQADLDAVVAQLSVITANPQTENYTLQLSDAGKSVEINNAAARTVTVPTNATAAFPLGTVIEVLRYGAGAVEVAPAGGVTILSAGGLTDIASQYAAVSLRKRDTNEWVLSGALA